MVLLLLMRTFQVRLQEAWGRCHYDTIQVPLSSVLGSTLAKLIAFAFNHAEHNIIASKQAAVLLLPSN